MRPPLLQALQVGDQRGELRARELREARHVVAGLEALRVADPLGQLVAAVRQNIGAVASLKRVDVVAALPKTRSGKILRKTMRGIADGRDEAPPSTIEDATVLDALKPVLQS